MDKELIKALVLKKIIKKGTKILASILRTGASGYPVRKLYLLTIDHIDDNKINFICKIPPNTNETTVINYSQILDIDGMDPVRLGKTFNLSSDGSYSAPGKKRGRKSKKLMV